MSEFGCSVKGVYKFVGEDWNVSGQTCVFSSKASEVIFEIGYQTHLDMLGAELFSYLLSFTGI